MPLPRLGEMTGLKPRVTSSPGGYFGLGREGPTCVSVRIVTSDPCNSKNESRKTYQIKFLAGVNVCHSVAFGLMASIYSRGERAAMFSLGREEEAQGGSYPRV